MTAATSLPAGFEDLERFVPDWARPSREERYAMRLSKTFQELEELYDDVAPKMEAAMQHLDGFDLQALPEEETRLLHLVYSFVLVSYAVNIFHQPRIPDSGAAFFDMVVEPAI